MLMHLQTGCNRQLKKNSVSPSERNKDLPVAAPDCNKQSKKRDAPWSEPETAIALKAWTEGGSYSIIANEIALLTGKVRTRCSVAGLMKRHGKRRAKPTLALPTKRPSRRHKTLNEILNDPPQGETDSSRPVGVTLVERAKDGCVYPFGTSGYTFCNKKKVPGWNYCKEHCIAVYRARQP